MVLGALGTQGLSSSRHPLGHRTDASVQPPARQRQPTGELQKRSEVGVFLQSLMSFFWSSNLKSLRQEFSEFPGEIFEKTWTSASNGFRKLKMSEVTSEAGPGKILCFLSDSP